VVNKSEPKPEGERRSFNNNRGGGDSRGGLEATIAVVVTKEEDINIFSKHKKKVSMQMIPFFYMVINQIVELVLLTLF
jgi:hypothetical protein